MDRESGGVVEVPRRLAVFVINRNRVRDFRGLRHRCEQSASAHGWASLILETTTDDPGGGAARRAVDLGAQLVCAAGGDGTVSACAGVLAGTGVPLAVVPAGSANLTASALRIPPHVDAALATAFGSQEASVDLATANGVPFTAMAGIGLDAAVVGAAPETLKRLTGWPAYALAATGQLLRRPITFTVRLDDGKQFTKRARSVAVGNCGLLPGGFPIMPDARMDDGILDVAILAPAGLLGWGSIGYRVLLHSRVDDSQLQRYPARKVEIQADVESPRQVDGEVIAPGRSLTVGVLPGKLLVRVPSAAKA